MPIDAQKLKQFFKSQNGNVALTFAIAAIPLIGSAGLAVDYSVLHAKESELQQAADAAALAAANEMSLSNVQLETLEATAEAHVFSNLAKDSLKDTSVKTKLNSDKDKIKVTLAHNWQPFLLQYIGQNVLPLKVSATAGLAGQGTICMISLDEKDEEGIYLTKRAHLKAPGCGVYANSTDKEAIKVEADGTLEAGVTCTAGGYKGSKSSSFLPSPITDCPQVKDPLAGRTTPTVGSCDYRDTEVKSGNHTFYPGTYCDGFKIKGSAKANLMPGIYVIKGDTFEVTDTASLEGEGVGIFLAGDNAKLKFKKQTTINLSAPTTGVMAGLLVFEGRTASKIEKHEITSDNARRLLGTIYLPNGTLRIDSEAPISDKAAYTAIIASKIELDEGPTLYLNSDYEATNVPVPEGLVGGRAYLTN